MNTNIPSLFIKKTVAIFGLGISGISTIKFFANSNVKVCAWDDNESQVVEAKKICADCNVNFSDPAEYNWQEIEMLVLAPGINIFTNAHRVVKMAHRHSCNIISDVCLFLYILKYNNGSLQNIKLPITCGIGGTNGKSTVTSLITHILKYCQYNVVCGGNIGIPVFDLAMDASYYIMEISSFQSDLFSFAPELNFAVLLDITPDHLHRYNSFHHYVEMKTNIFKNNNSTCLLAVNQQANKDIALKIKNKRPMLLSVMEKLDLGFSCIESNIYRNGIFQGDVDYVQILPENIIAAYATCALMGAASGDIIQGIKSFQNLEHRIEFTYKYKNINFINDSKATNCASANRSLALFECVFWIAGGRAKASDSIAMIDTKNVINAYFFGEDGELFYSAIGAKNSAKLFDNLHEALESAISDALLLPHEITILLSPACSSFDQWKNFAERGRGFKNIVDTLCTAFVTN